MKKTRIVSMILAMSFLLSACGSGAGQSETDASKTNRDAVFKEEANAFPLEEGDISQLVVSGDTIYVEQYIYDYNQIYARSAVTESVTAGVSSVMVTEEVVVTEEVAVEEVVAEDAAEESMDEEVAKEDAAEESMDEEVAEPDMEMAEQMPTTTRKITGFAIDGTVKSQFSQEMDMNSGTGIFAADSEGNIYSILYQYATYEGDDTTDKIYLTACAPDGTEKWKIHLNENVAEGEYFQASSLYCNDKNQIILDGSRGIEIYDNQGNPIKLIEKQNADDSRLFKIRDNKFAFVSSDGSSATIQTLDEQSGAFGEKVKLPFNYYRYQVNKGNVYDLYLSDDYGIYGYNIGDTEITKIMDYISSDFSSNYLYQTSFIDENTFVAYYYDEGVTLSKFTKVAPEDVVDKTELLVGCYYLDYNVKQKLVEFNKDNQEYRLNIRDYSVYDTMDDYTQGLTRLNADIVSGDVPDIMILNNQMPFNSYIAKGVFADLNTFLEKDTELKKEDLLPNILEAISSEDGLYRIAPTFSLTTFVAKTADVGEEPGWTMDEALALLATKPEGTQLLSQVTASSFLYYTVWICGEQYVDWDTGECFFDSEGFIKALEFAKTLPKEIDYSAIADEESYWQEMETQYREGKTILSLQYFSAFRDYNYARQAVFGEDVTMIGFPADEGYGAGLNLNSPMAISALSKNQDVAWEFVKSFFTEEYQDNLDYDFPIRVSSLEKLEEKAWEKPYYIDENGNKQEYDDYFYVNGVDILAEPLKPEETAEFMNYIKSLDKLCIYDETLHNIIVEETAGYFEGQKTAEEVASIIQSRAKIYVSENS